MALTNIFRYVKKSIYGVFMIALATCLQFVLHIVPVPQKQTRFTCRGKYPHAYDPSKSDLRQLQWMIKAYAPKEPIPGPVAVTYTFYLPIPKSTSRVKTGQMDRNMIKHISKPDVDNLAYLVTNAMKGIIYQDDSQIVEKHERKQYGLEPRIVVEIRDLNIEEGK
jgi:Holliday junction resolvase RusA-like endonuclease